MDSKARDSHYMHFLMRDWKFVQGLEQDLALVKGSVSLKTEYDVLRAVSSRFLKRFFIMAIE